MPAEIGKLAPAPGIFAVRRRQGAVRSRREASIKCVPVTGLSFLLLLFVGAGFVASDPGPRAVEARPALIYVQDTHLGYYEEHLARMALEDANCR